MAHEGNLGDHQFVGGAALVDIVAEHTHTCYKGDREHRRDWGYGCGICPACELRAKGYRQWKQPGAASA